MILGLDVSTSTIGCSLFKESGELMLLTHISPDTKENFLTKQDELHFKSNLFKDFLVSNLSKYPITRIIIEEPLINAKGTAKISAQLNQFAGMVFCRIREVFESVKVEYITVDEARRFGLPEYLGKKTMWQDVPKTIVGRKISDYRKMLVWGQVAKRFPEIQWGLTSNVTIDKKNFDKADSVMVVMGYMRQKGLWNLKPMETDSTIDYIGRYFEYLDGVESQQKELTTPLERKQLKNKLFLEFNLNTVNYTTGE